MRMAIHPYERPIDPCKHACRYLGRRYLALDLRALKQGDNFISWHLDLVWLELSIQYL
jgi:hypothetical protein